MIVNKGNLQISNDNPKTYTIIEKNGEYLVCKMLGQFDNLEDALELQTNIMLGLTSEEKSSLDFFNKINKKDLG